MRWGRPKYRYLIAQERNPGVGIGRESYMTAEGAKEIARYWADRKKGVRFVVVDTRTGIQLYSVRRPPPRWKFWRY